MGIYTRRSIASGSRRESRCVIRPNLCTAAVLVRTRRMPHILLDEEQRGRLVRRDQVLPAGPATVAAALRCAGSPPRGPSPQTYTAMALPATAASRSGPYSAEARSGHGRPG